MANRRARLAANQAKVKRRNLSRRAKQDHRAARRLLEEKIAATTTDGPDGCVLWTGPLSCGYGRISVSGRSRAAHRVVYEIRRGKVPAGLVLDHLCRVRNCVNPDHLEPVTDRENILRGVGRGALNARKTHCPRDHEYTDENTRVDSTGRRHCRTCERARSRERSQLRKEVRLEFVPRGQLASCLALVACLFLAACDASPTNTLRCASICEEAGAGGMGTFRRAGGYWDCTCRFSPEDS